MIRLSVFYPSGGRFDIEYYLSQHIPLVHRLLEPYGLVRTEVDKGIGSARPGSPAPYVAVAHLIFKSMESMAKGLSAHDPELSADVVNYTDIKPVFQISEMVR